jgi:hypothetical protein
MPRIKKVGFFMNNLIDSLMAKPHVDLVRRAARGSPLATGQQAIAA